MSKEILAKLSLIFGLTGLIGILILDSPFLLPLFTTISIDTIVSSTEGFTYYWSWLFDLSGLLFGILGLKSEKKIYAKAGIALSVLGLLGYLLFFGYLVMRFG